ncbi:hypothetical protein [Alicyclobacillus dauci]|uniref:Uncharacterized protein n=1 Tax=Alicyclobacillus dauci TaxID=1475485 RepID=A0ABY6Z461_9BACL|nr:hypothetical protein [Alicyclobacillus dauci]WAH37423.1 hypothetical protein NZD86_02465 [Alicyclobacillus dauci]
MSSSRRRRGAFHGRLILASSTLLFLACNTISLSAHAQQLRLNVIHVNAAKEKRLILATTGDKWFGKDIFQVTNVSSETLTSVSLVSWSNELLPILYVGLKAPAKWPDSSNELLHPPYELEPGQSLWFVGPHAPPVKFALNWLHDGQPQYEIIEADTPRHNATKPANEGSPGSLVSGVE